MSNKKLTEMEEEKKRFYESLRHERLEDEGFGKIFDSPEYELYEFYKKIFIHNLGLIRRREITDEEEMVWNRKIENRYGNMFTFDSELFKRGRI